MLLSRRNPTRPSQTDWDRSRGTELHPLVRRVAIVLPLRGKIPARSNHQFTTSLSSSGFHQATTTPPHLALPQLGEPHPHPWQPPPFSHTAPDPKLSGGSFPAPLPASPWPPRPPTPSYTCGLRLRAVGLYPYSVSARFTSAARHQPPTPIAASTPSSPRAAQLRASPAPRPTRRPPRARSTQRRQR